MLCLFYWAFLVSAMCHILSSPLPSASPNPLPNPRSSYQLGQHFTPPSIVKRMLGWRQNFATILDPAVGEGAFLSHLEAGAVGVEIDPRLTQDPRVVIGDFFALPISDTFDTIIGNPPYVRFQDIHPATKSLLPMELFDRRSNLYLFFIAKCMQHLRPGGELIFITPRDFLKATSAKGLNGRLYATGTLTHYEELGDANIFADASPNCALWRWEKGREDKRMLVPSGKTFHCQHGQIWFGGHEGMGGMSRVGDFFDVKVGAVSGADDVFASDANGCTEMVCSHTAHNGKTKRVIYNRYHPSLVRHKTRLMNRKIRRFDDSNWWQWGREYHKRDGWRIYVNAKTRHPAPFFISETPAYDGSVLALFPKCGRGIDGERAVACLNSADWGGLGFVCDGRFLFSQRSLAHAPLLLG